MSYLKDLGFSEEEIKTLDKNIPDRLKIKLKDNNKLVTTNLSYLKELGVNNYKEVFNKFYDTFLLDASTFKAIFDKYEPEDLISKIEKNINIIEYL